MEPLIGLPGRKPMRAVSKRFQSVLPVNHCILWAEIGEVCGRYNGSYEMNACRKRTRPPLQAVSGFLHTRQCNSKMYSLRHAYAIYNSRKSIPDVERFAVARLFPVRCSTIESMGGPMSTNGRLQIRLHRQPGRTLCPDTHQTP
jgi:hypothetical protein